MYDPDLESVVTHYHYVKPSVGHDCGDFFFRYKRLKFSSGWPEVVAREDRRHDWRSENR